MSIKVVFVGGGSYRTLPIVRAVLADTRIAAACDIVLVDFNIARAETVGRLIQKTPECISSGNCNVSWTSDVNRALPGADMVSVSFPVGSYPVCAMSDQASWRNGFHGLDQLSLSGAFRSLTGGPILLNLAKKMEHYCPKAWLVDFANPVAVYSGMVNNHTKIRALGICGGFANHRWDLTRLMGHDEYRDDYKVAVAGVNHMSFILGGTCSGRDLYKILGSFLRRRDWKPPRIRSAPQFDSIIRLTLSLLREMYFRFGIILFSTEFDGMVHIFKDELKKYAIHIHSRPRGSLKGAALRLKQKREKADNEFRAYLGRNLDKKFWEGIAVRDPHFAPDARDLTVSVLKALAGSGVQHLVASHPSRGAVSGFKENTVLEYSMSMDRSGITPDSDLEVPNCFHGLVSALATHQTMLGDAIATKDPRLFAHALFAYPVNQNSRSSKTLWKELLHIHGNEIDPIFQKAKNYF